MLLLLRAGREFGGINLLRCRGVSNGRVVSNEAGSIWNEYNNALGYGEQSLSACRSANALQGLSCVPLKLAFWHTLCSDEVGAVTDSLSVSEECCPLQRARAEILEFLWVWNSLLEGSEGVE